MELQKIDYDEYRQIAGGIGRSLPIEQTRSWAEYQKTVEGRIPYGYFKLVDGTSVAAIMSVMDFQTHGYHYLRSEHGPVWLDEPSEDQERQAVEAIRSCLRGMGSHAVFVRMAVAHELDATRPTLSTIPYDRTVIVDVTGGDEAILSRMKPRGRRDVRKALREAPVTCADETQRAIESFDEYYEVMVETGARDGFVPAPASDYVTMLEVLGPEHCRLLAGRDEDGRVVTWSICTISGTRATRYYAASRNETMRKHVSDKLVYFECCEMGRLGCEEYDLMAIGSEFSPSLMGLNEFKTKFCKEVAEVAPDRDVPLRPAAYAALVQARRLVVARRQRREDKARKGTRGEKSEG